MGFFLSRLGGLICGLVCNMAAALDVFVVTFVTSGGIWIFQQKMHVYLINIINSTEMYC